jgi:arsenate reductase (thioredoxin)
MPSSEERDVPIVLFVCVHNAGRSQLAAALLEHHARGQVAVRSAGTAPAASINPAVLALLQELDIDIRHRTPQLLTVESAIEADVVVTMGCGDTCPVFPGKRYLDWPVEDPAGLTLDQVRPLRDDIEARVLALLDELTATHPENNSQKR